jgi:transcriptional regulator with XRE-family HTH domain
MAAERIGDRLRRIRRSRGKSLAVIAGLAGISTSHLSQLESGKRALDRQSLIVALANALQVAPSELMRFPVPAPANGETDSGVEGVRSALMAVSHDQPGGQALPVEALRARVTAAVDALCRCEREREVGAALPETMQLAGFLALRRSVVAAADSRPGDVDPPLEYATELAERTGEGNAYGLGFGPINVGLYRMAGLLEAGEYERAASVAEGIDPEAHGNRSRQSAYWADYGRALARTRGRHDEAVAALRRAELISPHRVQRGPVIREVLAELLTRSRQDAVGRELRGMAYRAGLPV